MATIKFRDAEDNLLYLESDGAGTEGDPFRPKRVLDGNLPDTADNDLAALRSAADNNGLSEEIYAANVSVRATAITVIHTLTQAELARYKTLAVMFETVQGDPHDIQVMCEVGIVIGDGGYTGTNRIGKNLAPVNGSRVQFLPSITGFTESTNAQLIEVGMFLGSANPGVGLRLYHSASTAPTTGTMKVCVYGRR